ncbi:hypothetical protein AcW1_006539 [Taiwanofungus camphoratus]|nr:hypothetical protein AcV7_003038 [Antrodia cinnamomea]KAI0954746.1 hypothetical protein AcW1_006539 [Antrodia cinnamomea]
MRRPREATGTRSCGTRGSIVRCHRVQWPYGWLSSFTSGRLLPSHLSFLLAEMVSKNVAVYEPPKQTRAVLLYWRLPEEWAEALHEWAVSTGQLNTILTFYEIIEPPVPSPLSGIPITLLRKAVSILTKANRAQIIAVADGEGVRLLAGSTGK